MVAVQLDVRRVPEQLQWQSGRDSPIAATSRNWGRHCRYMKFSMPWLVAASRRCALVIAALSILLGWAGLAAAFLFECSRAGVLGPVIQGVAVCAATGLIAGMVARSILVPVMATVLFFALFAGWPLFGLHALGCSTG